MNIDKIYEFYAKNDGSTSKSTATALIAAVYKF
jgi:hypothetical protein